MQLSVKEAATRLGVPARTVRDRLQRGQLSGQRISTRSGLTWMVDWPDESASEIADRRAELRALIGETVGEVVGAIVAPLVERVEQTARENEALRAQVEALTVEAQSSKPTGESADDAEPRRWWQR